MDSPVDSKLFCEDRRGEHQACKFQNKLRRSQFTYLKTGQRQALFVLLLPLHNFLIFAQYSAQNKYFFNVSGGGARPVPLRDGGHLCRHQGQDPGGQTEGPADRHHGAVQDQGEVRTNHRPRSEIRRSFVSTSRSTTATLFLTSCSRKINFSEKQK